MFLTTLLSSVVGIVIASITAWATVATVVKKIERERAAAAEATESRRAEAAAAAEERREAAEERREEARRIAAAARETSLVDALARTAEAQAQAAVAIDAVADHVQSLRRAVERIPRMLSGMMRDEAPASEDERPSIPSPLPPPVPRVRTATGRHRAVTVAISDSAPLDSGRSALMPEGSG